MLVNRLDLLVHNFSSISIKLLDDLRSHPNAAYGPVGLVYSTERTVPELNRSSRGVPKLVSAHVWSSRERARARARKAAASTCCAFDGNGAHKGEPAWHDT